MKINVKCPECEGKGYEASCGGTNGWSQDPCPTCINQLIAKAICNGDVYKDGE